MATAIFQGNKLQIVVGGPEVTNKTGEYHSMKAAPSPYTLESGAVSGDHIVELPDGLEIRWFMSRLDGDSILDNLRQVIKARALYEVVTEHRRYSEMVCTGIDAVHESPFKGGLQGRVSFSHLPSVDVGRVTVPAEVLRTEGDIDKTASTPVDRGRVSTREPTESEEEEASSILGGLFGG